MMRQSDPPVPAQRLDDDLVLRRAETDDVEAVVALDVDAFGRQEVAAVRALLEGDLDVEWLVVAAGPDADRPGGPIAAACARIPHRYDFDGVAIPGSQLENVATAEPFRGRGLVRALFAAHHRRADADGELLQVIGGIPYFYRKLGYGYGFDIPPTYSLGPGSAAGSPDHRIAVRPALPADVVALAAAEAERNRSGLTVVRTEASLATWLARTATIDGFAWERLEVASHDDQIVGWVRLISWAEEAQMWVAPGMVADDEVADAFVARARDAGQALADHLGRDVEVFTPDRPGTPWSATVARHGELRPEPTGYYARTADEVGLLRTLEPVLSRRVAASRLAEQPGELRLSLYERGIRLAWADGHMTAIEPIAPEQDPVENGGVGVAPDWFPALVLGRWGARGLQERTDDTILGRDVDAMEILFPARPNDVVLDI